MSVTLTGYYAIIRLHAYATTIIIVILYGYSTLLSNLTPDSIISIIYDSTQSGPN